MVFLPSAIFRLQARSGRALWRLRHFFRKGIISDQFRPARDNCLKTVHPAQTCQIRRDPLPLRILPRLRPDAKFR
jgi:hypothetical protein